MIAGGVEDLKEETQYVETVNLGIYASPVQPHYFNR